MTARTFALPVDARKVSRILATRYPRSTKHGTAVRGIRRYTAGYEVHGRGDYVVEVTHRDNGLGGSGDNGPARLQAYAQTLRDAGYVVTIAGPYARVEARS